MSRASDVVVTGMGAVSALGTGCAALWRGVQAGRDGMRRCGRFRSDGLGEPTLALVPGDDDPTLAPDDDALRGMRLRFAELAGREALERARWAEPDDTGRLGIVIGASPIGEERSLHRFAEELGERLGAHGPRITITTACAASTNAIGLADELLSLGACDAALAGGADVVTQILYAGFRALGALSSGKCAPFSRSLGTTLGEGAAFLLLEKRGRAQRRGVQVEAVLLGYGLSCDAFHETSPDPSGAGVARSLGSALRHAGVPLDEVGYASLHGTGTSANDAAEWNAYKRVFAEHAQRLPASSTKSILGHAQAAAGALELVVAVQSMQRGVVPPTLHLTRARRGVPSDPVASRLPREAEVSVLVKTSAAFGGANAALVVSKPSGSRATAGPRRPVFVLGAGQAVGDGLADAHAALLQRTDPRALDRSARLLTCASAAALRAAGHGMSSPSLASIGLIAAITSPPEESTALLRRSVAERGLLRLCAGAFARTVPVAPAGACCRELGLKGPLSTLTVGPDSELLALVYACQLLESRQEVEGMLAARSTEEQDDLPACAMALALGTQPKRGTRGARVAGWSIRGPGDAEGAADAALKLAGIEDDAAFGEGVARGRKEPAGAAECLSAMRSIEEGSVQTALICSARGSAVSVAVVFTLEG